MAEYTPPLPDSDLSANGFMHCLRLLADEAASLGLARTYLAICQVLRICEAEHRPHLLRPAPGQMNWLQ